MLRRLKSLRRFFCVAFQSRQPVGQRVKSAICLLLLIIGFNLLVSPLVCTVFNIVYNWAFGYVIDENYGRIAPESVSNRDQVKHETICSSRSVPESCFSVVDHYDSKKNEVYRVLCTEGFDDEYETMVRLREPPGLDFQNSDTRTWKIDHKAISSQYIAALIAAPFMVGTLSLHNAMNIRKTMLNIGLGGGSLDMFLYKVAPEVNITVVELDPTMVELAHRWFGVVEDSHRRTIVADGIDVIRNAAKKNMTYDVVMLDACDGNRMFPCPAAVFRSDDVIVNIKKILKPMGCVVMNLLAMEGETMEKEIDTALELLKSHFPVCIKAWLPEDLNIPVVCLPYALQNSDSSLILYRKRFEKASAQLGLRDILKDVLFRSV